MNFPDRTLLSTDIINHFKHNKNFGGYYAQDELPKKVKNKFYVINMDSKNGPGTHYVCIYNCKPNVCIYFDSYGISPPEPIRKFMRTSKKTMIYPDLDLQDFESSNCGYFCVYVITQLEGGKTLNHIVFNDFNTTRIDQNEKKMNKMTL